MAAVLSSIDFWPATGFVGTAWREEPELDAWVKTSRRVCEAYSAALADRGLKASESNLRLGARATDSNDEDASSSDELVVTVFAKPGVEGANIEVPSVVADLPPLVRARLVLDVVDLVLRQLAPVRSWPLAAVDALRQEVLDTGLGFWWMGREVSSPDRRRSARTHFSVSDDGFGRVRVQIREKSSETLVGASAPLLAYSTIEGFRRTAKSLHWDDRDHLSLVHFSDVFGFDQRSITIDIGRDLQPVPAVHAQIHPHRHQPATVTPRVVLAPPPQPCIRGGSGGPMNDVPPLYQAATQWMFGHIPPALTAWWAKTGLLELSVFYDFWGSKPSARLYRRGDNLEATLRRPMPDPATTADPIGTAYQDVLTVLAAVRRRFKLPPHPQLPQPSTGDLDDLVVALGHAEDGGEYPLDLEKLKGMLQPGAIGLQQQAPDFDTD